MNWERVLLLLDWRNTQFAWGIGVEGIAQEQYIKRPVNTAREHKWLAASLLNKACLYSMNIVTGWLHHIKTG